MSKAQFPSQFNWQTTDPALTFFPNPGPGSTVAGNSPPIGVLTGAMASTNTIYSNILGLRQTDNQSLGISWTGTPTGSYTILVSTSGKIFQPLSGFSASPSQPSGSADGQEFALQNIPFQYMYIKYVNSSGTGVLSAYSQCKANNS